MDLLFLFRRVSYYQYQIKKKYNARYNVEKKGKTVCKQLFSTIIILHKISKQINYVCTLMKNPYPCDAQNITL